MDVKSASERLTRWRQGLAQSPVPETQRQGYSQAVERFLVHIGEDPLKITRVKARQFMAETIQKQVLGAHQAAIWKEALNWFFGWWHSASAPPPSRDVPPLAAADLGRTDWENQLVTIIRRRHLSWRTEETYRGWAVRFARFLGPRPVREAGENEAKAFLDHLAVAQRVSASTQRQALNAVVFLLREALGKNLGDFSDFTKACRPRRLPEVLTPEECRLLFNQLTGTFRLMAELIGTDIRTVQDLLGHADIRTTQIYLHVIKKPGIGVRSPLDG